MPNCSEISAFQVHRALRIPAIWAILLLLLGTASSKAQMDQGAITGTVVDTTGAVIPAAEVTLTNVDTGFVLHTHTDPIGGFVFSPIKIGNYSMSVTAKDMQTTTQDNIRVNIQQRLAITITLRPGSATETITVSTAPPLLQTQESSIGQVISTTTINNTPLNGRNWVYIAQLTAGVTPGTGARGQGTGDFNANGQRAEQNNFILDGVDNNVNVVDFVNGASYVVRPPPDALAEFKIQTGDYSAEFGHSAGAVINASIKSGTNQIHGDLWEYVRNDYFDALNFNALTNPEYRENQFGATLGLPILRNKLFFFGDTEANRIIYGVTKTLTVPTALMREGNFSELLNPSLTGQSKPIQLYQPGSGGTSTLSCNGQNNVFCSSQIDTVAQHILSLYPQPNANDGLTYNNYVANFNDSNNTFQWDTRADWNASTKDLAFTRFSYDHEQQYLPPALGILDGGGFEGSGSLDNLGENFVLSETHIFNPNVINEFRFGYNYGHYLVLQPNYDTDLAPTLGFGGIPYTPSLDDGGIPDVQSGGITTFGTSNAVPTKEGENVYQILDNFTKNIGNHSLKFGINIQSIRFTLFQPTYSTGLYQFTGAYTSNLSAAFTGYGTADFLANEMHSAQYGTLFESHDSRWYRTAYAQDDWKVSNRFMLNIGLRYEYTQPYKERLGQQANFVPGSADLGTGTGIYEIPTQSQTAALSSNFTSLLAKDNITLQYSGNPFLVVGQKANFAPRIGAVYQLSTKTVVRAGFGIFFGGLENRGGATNLSDNYPFQFTDTFPAQSCKAGYGNCPTNGIALETGFSSILAGGIQNDITTPVLYGWDPLIKTPYSIEDNLTVERSLSNNLVASMAYIGTLGRHLQVPLLPNSPAAIENPSNSVQSIRPFPDFGNGTLTASVADSDYNSLQAKLEKRYAGGLNFLGTYTWSHSLDDAPTTLSGDLGYPNTVLIPISYWYSNSGFDVRQRLTFNSYYQLPFGRGQRWMNRTAASSLLAGGWAASLTFVAQTGEPFTVSAANITGAAGISALAMLVRNPFKAGGSPDPSNPTITCATSTRNKLHWFNPCAFANPLNGTNIPKSGQGSQITALSQVLQYQGGRPLEVPGPGYERINMSFFKNIPTYRDESLQFRADAFNLLNTPAYGTPSGTDANTGGLITAPRTQQNYTPDARFFQLSAKYVF